MKKLLFILFLLCLPLTAQAVSISSINPVYVTPGETMVTINGSGFGNSSSGKYIYFGYSSAYSTNWSDTKITIKTPYDIYKSGNIEISGSFKTGENCSYGYCYDQTDYLTLTSQTYYLKPEITKSTETVYSNGYFEVVGYYFGSTQGTVKIGGQSCRIVEWESNYLKCEIAEITSNATVVNYSIKVPESNNYELTGRIDFLPNISNDTYSFYQTYLKQIGVTDIWDNYSGAGVKVAIIDSGIDINSPDLKYSLWINYSEKLNNEIDDDGNGYTDDYYGYNFIDNNADMSPKNNHGTQVAGIISASRNNNLGIAGIAPNAKVMSLIACDKYGCPLESVKNAIKYAVDNGANIINLSLGGDGSLGYDPSYDEVIKYAYDKNVLIVAAAGNGDTEGSGTRGQDMDKIKASPVCNEADINMILGVGAINEDNEPTIWTNYSIDYVDVSAPGIDILSTAVPLYTEDDSWYSFANGTSFSAPIIVGISALLKEKNPSWKNYELMSQIISRSDDFKNSWNVYGKIVNAKNIIGKNNPLPKLESISPSIINENNSILHIYGKNFYSKVKIKIFNNNFNGYIPANILEVNANQINVDLSKWLNLVPFTGIFSISIEGDSTSDTKKNTLTNAIEIKGLKENNNNQPAETENPTEPMEIQTTVATNNFSITEFIEQEKKLISTVDNALSKKLAGKILLQVENNGEGWYINPANNKKYYLGRPADAFNLMKELGLGINNNDFDSFGDYAPSRLSGKILLKVEDSGMAYYVNPIDLKMHYLGRPTDAFNIMKELGLGITNIALRKIDIN